MGDRGIISIYLPKTDMAELDRRCNYKRQSRSEWVKQRILAILGTSRKTLRQRTKSKKRGVKGND